MKKRVFKRIRRDGHGSLNELNITPLLDLAFVFFIIFIITTTPAMPDLPLNLPQATKNPKPITKDPNTVAVDKEGRYYFNDVHYPALRDLYADLVAARKANTNIIVVVRGDMAIQYQKVISLLDVLSRANVVKVGLMTSPQ